MSGARHAPFRRERLPTGTGARGWLRAVDRTWSNGWYAVLGRPVATPWGRVLHLAIRNAPNTDIPWADKQWLKDVLCGPDRCAVEVFPPADQLVDGANMYHLWVLPAGMRLPFGIHAEAGDAEQEPQAGQVLRRGGAFQVVREEGRGQPEAGQGMARGGQEEGQAPQKIGPSGVGRA